MAEGQEVICMNSDSGVFSENCRIHDMENHLPLWHRLYPFYLELGGSPRLASGDLHRLTDTPLVGHTHNALHDVRSMAVWLAYQKRQGLFQDISQLPTEVPTVDPRSLKT